MRKVNRRVIAFILLIGLSVGARDLSAASDARVGDASYSSLSLEKVARDHYETDYEEVSSAYGGPISRGAVISVKAHPELVWVRPDMGIGMIANPIAFATGIQPTPILWRDVSHSLYRGYMPIITSSTHGGKIRLEEVAYATLLNAPEVKTGHEKQLVVARVTAINPDPTETRHAVWWAYVPGAVPTTDGEPYFWSYKLFEVTGSLPEIGDAVKSSEDVLRNGNAIIGVHQEGPGVSITRYKNALRFEATLLPGQRKSILLKVSTNKNGFSESELGLVRKLDFQSGLDARAIDLDAILANGTQISVPEDIVNNIYKAQILYNQTQMVQAADRDYYMPVQGSYGVWPWEQMKQLVPLDEYGYHDDVKKSLTYFLKIQGSYRPHAQVTSADGVFPATGKFEQSGWENDSDSTIYGFLAKQRKNFDFPNWTNNTGSALTAFAQHYFYSKDREWLRSVAPALVNACNWIVQERKQTMHLNSDGTKPLEYGLMPAGEGDDTSNKPTYNLFTDAYQYQGLQAAANALNDIGFPGSKKLLEEAASYRNDILEVMRRTRRTDPTQSPYPQRLYQPDDWTIYATGPLALVDTGLLDPTDPAFVSAEKYLEAHTNEGVLGLMGYIPDQNPQLHGEYYMVTGEDPYHYALTARGEVEKALLVFYSTLAYGVDHETLGAVERFDLYDRRYAPFFIDSSGSMRICDMIRRTLLFERNRTLEILPVAPRRWLESGKQIEVKGAVTRFGSVDFSVNSHANAGRITVDLHLHNERPDQLRQIVLRIPNPNRAPIRSAEVNGSAFKDFNAAEETITLSPGVSDYKIAVQY